VYETVTEPFSSISGIHHNQGSVLLVPNQAKGSAQPFFTPTFITSNKISSNSSLVYFSPNFLYRGFTWSP